MKLLLKAGEVAGGTVFVAVTLQVHLWNIFVSDLLKRSIISFNL
jgi:hypothetical protein